VILTRSADLSADLGASAHDRRSARHLGSGGLAALW
jgi:hypothetical protein